jgi:hypothetical protein
MWWRQPVAPGAERIDQLAAYREAGVSRVQTLLRSSVDSDEPLDSFAEDARAAGATIAAPAIVEAIGAGG